MPRTAGGTVVEHFLSVCQHFTETALLHHGLDVCSLCIESAHKLHQETLQDVTQFSIDADEPACESLQALLMHRSKDSTPVGIATGQ